jgi:hypothetical protein
MSDTTDTPTSTEPIVSAPTPPRAVVRDGSGRFAAGSGKPRRRGPGAPVGNLNASKAPWRSFWKRHALRPEDRWLLPLVESYMVELESDKGDATAGERRLMEVAATARGVVLLILRHAADKGFVQSTVGGGWALHEGVKELVRFMGLERGALTDLGLERRARKLPGKWSVPGLPAPAVVDAESKEVA